MKRREDRVLTEPIVPVPGKLVRLLEVGRCISWLPSGRRKDELHGTVFYRWFTRGLKRPGSDERVKLKAIRAGGALCTTEEWLRDFFDELSEATPRLIRPRLKRHRLRHMLAAEQSLGKRGM